MLQLTGLELDRALRTCSQVVIEGPRCIGQTAGVRRQAGQLAARRGWLLEEVNLAECRAPEDLCAILSQHLDADLTPEKPAEFQQALASDYEERRGAKRVLLLENAHRLDSASIDWLISAFSWGGFRPASVRTIVVTEGALKLGEAIKRGLGAGASFPPRLLRVEEVPPWLRLEATYRLTRTFGVNAAPALVHWLVDATGGDTGFLVDVLGEISNDEELDEEGLVAAADQALLVGTRAAELRTVVTECAAWRPLKLVACGSILHAPRPAQCNDPLLRKLYWIGLLDYSRLWRGYRVRGSLAARLLRGETGCGVSLDEPLARARHLLGGVGAVELCLRACLDTHPDLESGMHAVTGVGFQIARRKALFNDLAKAGIGHVQLAVIRDVFDIHLPAQVSLKELAGQRSADPDDVRRLSALTLNELIQLALELDVFSALDSDVRDRLAKGRNDVAHFRALPYSLLRQIDLDVRRVVRALAAVHAREDPVQGVGSEAVDQMHVAVEAPNPERDPE